jgi:hypothetical protein
MEFCKIKTFKCVHFVSLICKNYIILHGMKNVKFSDIGVTDYIESGNISLIFNLLDHGIATNISDTVR